MMDGVSGEKILWGGIEAGGTKINCAIAQTLAQKQTQAQKQAQPHPTADSLSLSKPQLLAHIRIPTTTPEATLTDVIDFFRVQQQHLGEVRAIGLGCFGPIDLNPDSATFGYLLDTPKPGWQQIDVVGILERSLQLPIHCDTDVNAAALGEHHWGAARGVKSFVYLTVGTGIGGGAMVNGQLLHGLLHPEMGHVPMPQNLQQDPFPGCCPFHGNCLEGLASGSALASRWGKSAEELPPDHVAWELEAEYLAIAATLLTFTLSPQRIILGGGVMRQQQLLPQIHRRARAKLESYLAVPHVLEQIEDYIVSPKLNDQAGILGAIALAQQVRSDPEARIPK